MSRWPDFGPESLAENLRAGVECMEVAFNAFWHPTVSRDELYARVRCALRDIRASGMSVWSVHLPYSPLLDISAPDSSTRRINCTFISEMIALAAEFKPHRLVLHPSSEPILSEERELRLAYSHDSIGHLAQATRDTGTTLCVENLPRTGLGQTAEEMLRLTKGYPDVCLCFDVNHLVQQSHAEFLRILGPGHIATVHLSDYDLAEERHWLPGKGSINWGELWQGLCQVEYEGPLLMECHGTATEIVAAGDYIIHSAAKSPSKR